jgi:hypothetical protein
MIFYSSNYLVNLLKYKVTDLALLLNMFFKMENEKSNLDGNLLTMKESI